MCRIRGEGEQIMPPWIIFHGAGYISQGEADYYDALGIGWHFQANAYADAAYSRKWLRAFIATLKAKGLGKFALKETCFTLLATVSKTQKANAQSHKFSLERQNGSH